MEITKTFANTFHDMMHAKLRWFVRRSLFRYAIAVSLITYGLHAHDASLEFGDKLLRGGLYFVAVCIGVLVVVALGGGFEKVFSKRDGGSNRQSLGADE